MERVIFRPSAVVPIGSVRISSFTVPARAKATTSGGEARAAISNTRFINFIARRAQRVPGPRTGHREGVLRTDKIIQATAKSSKASAMFTVETSITVGKMDT
ncbi:MULTISPECIES: hypothetical protein [Sinorhizobium]|uniref:hypothetical protein n=1 Tax=Sinorhizobium TaxID=28105 RepID=UPI001F21B4B1|nr:MULTISPECIES: hypothetical protein [Sinorhizobium]